MSRSAWTGTSDMDGDGSEDQSRVIWQDDQRLKRMIQMHPDEPIPLPPPTQFARPANPSAPPTSSTLVPRKRPRRIQPRLSLPSYAAEINSSIPPLGSIGVNHAISSAPTTLAIRDIPLNELLDQAAAMYVQSPVASRKKVKNKGSDAASMNGQMYGVTGRIGERAALRDTTNSAAHSSRPFNLNDDTRGSGASCSISAGRKGHTPSLSHLSSDESLTTSHTTEDPDSPITPPADTPFTAHLRVPAPTSRVTRSTPSRNATAHTKADPLPTAGPSIQPKSRPSRTPTGPRRTVFQPPASPSCLKAPASTVTTTNAAPRIGMAMRAPQSAHRSTSGSRNLHQPFKPPASIKQSAPVRASPRRPQPVQPPITSLHASHALNASRSPRRETAAVTANEKRQPDRHRGSSPDVNSKLPSSDGLADDSFDELFAGGGDELNEILKMVDGST